MRKLNIIAFLLVGTGLLFAQTSGKVSGRVLSEDGQVLTGANVVVEGTSFGAATDEEGTYYILEVPAGVYSVRVDYIGYKSHTISNVRIHSDLTSFVDFSLAIAAVEGEAVEVIGEAPLLEISATNAVRTMDSEQIANFAARDVNAMIAAQAGVTNNNEEIHLRGSRQSEVGFMIDGVTTKAARGIGTPGSIQNFRETGGSFNIINAIPEALQEVSIQSGGYSAEYGGATAGIVQQTMKTGGRTLSGTVSYETDGLAESFDTEEYGYSDITATLGGPITSNIRFFTALRNTNEDNYAPQFWTGATIAEGALLADLIGGQTPSGDSIAVIIPDKIEGRTSEEMDINGTLLFDFNPLVIRATGAYTKTTRHSNEIPIYNMFNLERQRKSDWNIYLGALKATYFLNTSTYMNFTISGLDRQYEGYDPNFAHNDLDDLLTWGDSAVVAEKGLDRVTIDGVEYDGTWNSRWIQSNAYEVYGFQFNRPGRMATNYQKSQQSNYGFKGGFATQMGTHEIKIGVEYLRWTMRNYGATAGLIRAINQQISVTSALEDDFANESDLAATLLRRSRIVNIGYDEFGNEITDADHVDGPKHPYNLSFYLNDKVEKEDLVINAGIRVDSYFLDDWKLLDVENPPYDQSGASVHEEELLESDIHYEIQPRLGLGFPISDKAVFHLQYGRFVQMPDLAQAYKSRSQMALYFGGQNMIQDPVGFDLEPVVTEQFEVGFGYQFGNQAAFDVTVFAKNTTGQIETQRTPVNPGNTYGAGEFSFYDNGDFTNVSGVELTVRTRRINNLQIDANYTYTDARGTNSFPNSGAGHTELTGDNSGAPTAIAPLFYENKHKGSIIADLRFGENEAGLLANSGLNFFASFNSGHPFTLSTGGMGQRNSDEGALLNDQDPRNRTPVEPLGASTTPWIFNVDLRADKSFRAGPVMLTVFARVSNLFNTKHVLNVYNRTGNAYDDGFLTDPELSAQIVENLGDTYAELYQAVNLDNRAHYMFDYGFDLFGAPREIRFGVTASF
jgi:hypothetical protein